MAHDNNIRLLGSSGNPKQTISANGSGSAVYVGAYKAFTAELRIAGVVTGTGPVLTMRVQESPDGSSSWVTIGTFNTANPTVSNVGYFNGSTPRFEVPGTNPLGIAVETTKPYARADWTVAGTTPVFTDTSVELAATRDAYQRSGV